MKRLFQIGCVLLSGILMFTSCLKSDDDDVTLYDDMAITTFTLGTLNRYLHTTNTAGEDSIYKTTVTGSSYVMSIDQLKHEIYNLDSLPVGTDAAHVLVTIGTKNSGVVLLKSATSDSLFYYSSSDSIDFSTERQFQVYSTDGSGHRSYTVRLNVRQQEEASGLAWKQVSGANEQMTTPMAAMSARWWNGGLAVLCTQWDGYTHAFTSADGLSWTALADYDDSPNTGSPYSDVAVKDGCLYVLSAGELLCYAADGQLNRLPATGLTRLLGASTTELYATDENGRLVASPDNGQTWTVEELDEDASLLPTSQLRLVSFPYSTVAETDYVLLVGYAGGTPRIWRKVNEYGAGAAPSKWVYMPLATDNRYQLPALTDLSLACYDGYVLAIGREGIYVSRDQGITWKKNTNYLLPGNAGTSAQAVTTDGNGALWLVTSDWQVWRTK